MQIEQWLWQLRDEVKKLQELGLLLKRIGCFRLRPMLPSAARPQSRAFPTNSTGSPMPPLSPTIEQPSESMMAAAVSSPEPAAGGGKEGDLAGICQDETTSTRTDKNVAFAVSPADDGRGGSEHGAPIDFRVLENQVQEGLESIVFHQAILQRSVDQAHINMRSASQEFSSLLKKVLKM